MRRVAVVALLALAMSAACIPPEDVDRVISYSEDTVMGEIQAAGRLHVALPTDRPPLDRVTGGFTHDLARLIAKALGVELTVRLALSNELLGIVERGEADIAFPAVAITEELARANSFTDPFYVAHQRLLVPAGSGITDVDQLSGLKVCHYIDTATEVDLNDLNEALIRLAPIHPFYCAQALKRGEADVATASDVALMTMLEELPAGAWEIAGPQLSTEGYGAVVEHGADAFVDLVNDLFAEAKQEGVWMELYDKWFGPILGDQAATEPPDMTVEEAAALFPRDYD